MATGSLRLAAPGDLHALKTLVEKAYRGETARAGWTHEADLLDGERISLGDLAAMLEVGHQRIIIAEGPERPAGSVAITNLGNGRAYLGMLCVDPALQANGLGRRLIAQAEKMAAELFGADTMEMTVISLRQPLIDWYRRCGYALTGEIRPFPVPGVDLEMVVMERNLR